MRYEGGIWWADPNGGRNKFTPFACSHTGSETAVTFTPIGFSIEKFGVQVSFEYLPD